jgi:hypothetical protein
MNHPIIRNVETIRERELGFALAHVIEWIEECAPEQDTRWHRNVLANKLRIGEKSLADVEVSA